MQIWFVSERRRDLKYFFWCEFPRIFLFVSLRRRELKFHYYGSVLLHSGSSPCGDVSCNTESAFKEHLKEGVRSLAEM